MKEKLKKIIYEYDLNSRNSTKELGKKTNTSQQSAFYLISSLKEKKIITNEICIIDPLKLGYINTLVGFNFILLDEKIKTKIITRLCEYTNVISIEESKEGFDILAEFSTRTLGEFDQIHRKFVEEFNSVITTEFIFPIITKFLYPKKYLKEEKVLKETILFGNSEPIIINQNEKNLLKIISKDPIIKIIDLAYKSSLNVKGVAKIKKDLEDKQIIRGYGCVFNHKKLNIKREIIFLRFTSAGLKDIQKVIDYAKKHKNVVEISKLIGSSQLVLVIESLEECDIIKEIRSSFAIKNYMIFKSEKIHKKTYYPFE